MKSFYPELQASKTLFVLAYEFGVCAWGALYNCSLMEKKIPEGKTLYALVLYENFWVNFVFFFLSDTNEDKWHQGFDG